MKKFYNINNESILQMEIEGVNIIDICIWIYCCDFINSGNCDTVRDGGQSFHWIGYGKILKDNPFLGIATESGIKKKMQRLCDFGLLIKCSRNQKLKRTYWNYSKEFFTRYNFTSLVPNGATRPSQMGRLKPDSLVPNGATYSTLPLDSTLEDKTIGLFSSGSQSRRFEAFKKIMLVWPSKKRKAETEFDNFKKKYSQFGVGEIEFIASRIVEQKRQREICKSNNKFAPAWGMLSSFINQKKWEFDYITDDNNPVKSPGESPAYLASLEELIDSGHSPDEAKNILKEIYGTS